MNSGEVIDYGLGLQIGTYRGLPTIGHAGSDAGYRAEFLRFPNQRLSIAVLCNYPTSDPGTRAQKVADIVLEKLFSKDSISANTASGGNSHVAAGVPDPVLLRTDEAVRLEGFYVRPGYDGPTEVLTRKGLLFVGDQRLLHKGEWNFQFSDSGQVVRFEKSSIGAVSFKGPDGFTYTRRPAWQPVADDLAPFAGRYWSDDLGVEYEVRLDAGTLKFWTRKAPPKTLRPTFQDAFAVGERGENATFIRNPNGSLQGFTLSSPRAWKVRFRRLAGPYPN